MSITCLIILFWIFGSNQNIWLKLVSHASFHFIFFNVAIRTLTMTYAAGIFTLDIAAQTTGLSPALQGSLLQGPCLLPCNLLEQKFSDWIPRLP